MSRSVRRRPDTVTQSAIPGIMLTGEAQTHLSLDVISDQLDFIAELLERDLRDRGVIE